MASEARMRTAANRRLAAMPNYHRWIPTGDIDAALEASGLRRLEPAIYCGRQGRINEQVGERTWLTMTWYRLDSGNYEIVAYVS
jgi:hypothetical protein